MEKMMKKAFIIFILLLSQGLFFAETPMFSSLDSFLKSETEQELEVTNYDFTKNQITKYMHIKKINEDTVILGYNNGSMYLKRIRTEQFRTFCNKLKELLSAPKISEYALSPVDDATMIISIVFRGEINCSIPMFNITMLLNDDYRKIIYDMIEKLGI